MLRTAFRKTSIGRQREVFAKTTHRMLLGLWGVDVAGNVIFFPQYKAGESAGSWVSVVQDSVSYPLSHWAAEQRDFARGNVDVFDRSRLCRSPTTRRIYKAIRFCYNVALLFCAFMVYCLVKQNAFNLEARIQLTQWEGVASKYLEQLLVGLDGEMQHEREVLGKKLVNLEHRHQGSDLAHTAAEEAHVLVAGKEATRIAPYIRSFAVAVRDLAFALAEDVGAFDAARDAEDRLQIAMMERERLVKEKKKYPKQEVATGVASTRNIIGALSVVASVLAVVMIV